MSAQPAKLPRWVSSLTTHRQILAISGREWPSSSLSLRIASAHSSSLIFRALPKRALLGQLSSTASW